MSRKGLNDQGGLGIVPHACLQHFPLEHVATCRQVDKWTMTRTLPWLKDCPTRKTAKPLRAKAQKVDHASDEGAATPQRRAYRTPSTSPPPAPPIFAGMRPGLTADDIYIMVEDEFHACAQQFTKHLHHAEYQRLKNTSSQRNASAITDIARPVDSITAMRAETKKKKYAEAHERKIGKGLKAMNAIAREKRVAAGGDQDSDSGFEMDKSDGPWQGTQLQRFMTTSPRKNLTSLTGLQGIVSNTKAAAGLDRSKKEEDSGRADPSEQMSRKTPATEVLDEDTEDDDDLDAPNRTRVRITAPAPVARSYLPKTPTASLPSPSKRPAQRSFLDLSPINTPSSTGSVRKTKHEVPRLEPIIQRGNPSLQTPPLSTHDAIRLRLKARREREEREKKKKSSSGLKVDEIPIFLV